MAQQFIECYVLDCDHCGYDDTGGDFKRHYGVGKHHCDEEGWVVCDDGTAYCEECVANFVSVFEDICWWWLP